ncbi:hypothetical protein, partial [Mesorhizobium sp. M5C.F.Ca.IN.020.29.1.1]|uniref:hypothetical protein n=1 Tax=Mesorhizobium sp. M5C.F.Ca.IN.020.29.1.1 TaxID=2496770 RepID=UPI0019D2D63B
RDGLSTPERKPPVPGRVPELAAAATTREFSMPTIREYSLPDDKARRTKPFLQTSALRLLVA